PRRAPRPSPLGEAGLHIPVPAIAGAVRPRPAEGASAVPMPFHKYRPYDTVDLPDRTWPNVVLDRAPIWCSTDLRAGNQALVNPMDPVRKSKLFALLLELGSKEIGVGLRSGWKAESDFARSLIEGDLVPADVTIAVLTPARPGLIERTYEAVPGARGAIVHLYNSTSVTRRR